MAWNSSPFCINYDANSSMSLETHQTSSHCHSLKSHRLNPLSIHILKRRAASTQWVKRSNTTRWPEAGDQASICHGGESSTAFFCSSPTQPTRRREGWTTDPSISEKPNPLSIDSIITNISRFALSGKPRPISRSTGTRPSTAPYC